jgi:tetratricopeptide (TPR) repeat protein
VNRPSSHRPDQDSAVFVQGLAATGDGQVNAVLDGDQYNYIYRDNPPYRVTPFAATVVIPAGLARVPSRLLMARHQVVPFVDRPELERLRDWRDSALPGVSVCLVYAEGGQGKTRLAVEFAARSARTGWAVAVARHRSEAASAGGGDDHLAVRPPGLLLIVDYAERWPLDDLIALIRQHESAARDRLRILLLSRSAGSWWEALAGKLSRLGVSGIEAIRMLGLPEGPDARARMYAAARDRFAEIFTIAAPAAITAPADLDDPLFALTLTVHMRALVDVDAAARGRIPPPDSHQAGLSSYLLDREHDYWRSSHDGGHGPVQATETAMGRAVYVATLTRLLPRVQAAEALARAQAASSPQLCAQLLDDHARCYPPPDPDLALEPLDPDRLGEDFLALTLPGREDKFGYHATDMWTVTAPRLLLAPTGRNASPAPGARQAMATLIQAASRWPHVTQLHLLPLLATRPQLALAAGGIGLAALVSLPGLDQPLLEDIEACLPAHGDADLDVGIAALAQRLAGYRLPVTSDPAERARINNNLGQALYRAGLYQQALAPVQEAVNLYWPLALANSFDYGPSLATSIGNLGSCLSELGQWAGALTYSELAVEIMRLMPGEYTDPEQGLADALRSFGTHLTLMGRWEEGLAAIEEAVAIHRRLATDGTSAAARSLSMTMNNLGVILARLGRQEEALAAAEEAVGIDRRLAAANPAASEPGLATSLSSLASRLKMLGRREESVTASRESVQIRRRLAAANPAAFEAALASSLETLGLALPPEDHDEATALLEEVVQIRRRLAAANPAASEDGLAAALGNLGFLWSMTGRREEALVPSREAMHAYRRLAAANPAAFEPELAKSSRIFAAAVAMLALARQLHAINQDIKAINPGFQDTGPAIFQDSGPPLGEEERAEALAAIQDSAEILQRLVVRLPQRYQSELRLSLSIAVQVLNCLARPEDASELKRLTEAGHLDQAVDLLREAAHDGNRVFPVRGNVDGRPAWHVVKVAHSKLAKFKQALKTGSLDVSDYGEILHSGWGKDPPEEITRELRERYGG